MIYTIQDIASILKRNKLVIRHWILWDEENENKYIPKPIKNIKCGSGVIRIYDEYGLQIFKEFAELLKENPGLMAEYNKKHFSRK